MDPKQAFEIVAKVTGLVQLNRQDHVAVSQALQAIQNDMVAFQTGTVPEEQTPKERTIKAFGPTKIDISEQE